VDESESASDIEAALSAKCGNTGGVPLHDDRGREALEHDLAVDGRKTSVQATVSPERGRSRDQCPGEK
jgi:hypothetical protein